MIPQNCYPLIHIPPHTYTDLYVPIVLYTYVTSLCWARVRVPKYPAATMAVPITAPKIATYKSFSLQVYLNDVQIRWKISPHQNQTTNRNNVRLSSILLSRSNDHYVHTSAENLVVWWDMALKIKWVWEMCKRKMRQLKGWELVNCTKTHSLTHSLTHLATNLNITLLRRHLP